MEEFLAVALVVVDLVRMYALVELANGLVTVLVIALLVATPPRGEQSQLAPQLLGEEGLWVP